MEFCSSNFINTITGITVNSNTNTASNLLTRDETQQYVSDGLSTDGTISTLHFPFSSTQSVSRIGLMGLNWKDFTIFYNGVTANTFAFTTTAATTTSDFSSNSETGMFFFTTPVNCTSVSINISHTQVANSEKAIGYIYIGNQLLDFARIPSSQNYKPQINPKQIVHNMAEGSTRTHSIDEKFSTTIKLTNCDATFRNSLRTLHRQRTPLGFVDFPTSTGWNVIFYEVVWPGKFDGYNFSDDAAAAGFDVNMDLRERTRV